LTGLPTECRLFSFINPITEREHQCKAGKDVFHQSLKGFSSSVALLIFAAFHLEKADETTHLDRCISLMMIQWFEKHTIGLAYNIVLSGKSVITYEISFN
jgi:di/tricarboxylate transporter